MTYKEDLVTREVHSVLRRVEEWVNDPYLREVRGVPIGVGLREADREQALAWVLKTLDAHTRRRARLERLADKGRRSWEPPRTTSELLANPIGEIAKRAHERSAPL